MLAEHLARRGRRRGFGQILDEWASLVLDRDGVMRHLDALQAAREADRHAHLDDITRLHRIINTQAAQLAKMGYRKVAKHRAKAPQPAVEPDLDAVPSGTPCGPCGGLRTALDDVLGLEDCRACRAARLPPPAAQGGPPGGPAQPTP